MARAPKSSAKAKPSGGRRRARGRRPRAPGAGPGRASPARRWIALALLVLAGAVGGWWCWSGHEPTPPLGGSLAVGWPAGLAADEAAELLADLGLTKDPVAVALYFRLSGASRCFRPGAHLLPRGANSRLLRRLLCADPSRDVAKLTIPEGFTRFAIADRLEQLGICSSKSFQLASTDAGLLRQLGVEPGADSEVDTAEGYLFPATYELPLDSDPAVVLRRLVRELDRRFAQITALHGPALDLLAAEFQYGRREVLTLASMVEKETAVADERPMVARAFLNRLRDPGFEPRLLQSDPTAMYGCLALGDRVPSCRGAGGKPSPAINKDPANRYSTYAFARLPPGPIANPGDAAISAVLAPAEGSYLYFVARGDGRHTFSRTLAEHNLAVEALRRRRDR